MQNSRTHSHTHIQTVKWIRLDVLSSSVLLLLWTSRLRLRRAVGRSRLNTGLRALGVRLARLLDSLLVEALDDHVLGHDVLQS